MQKFWTYVSHALLIAAGGYIVYRYPAVAPYIVPVLAGGNAALPSPFQPTSGTPSENITKSA